MDVVNIKLHIFAISCILNEKNQNFNWKLLMVYGPVYEDRKIEFIDELHSIMATWQGPILVGGDFNLCRVATDKNNRRINQKIVDCFND
jgi:endonuclease/exonuclease/phosphatase (EEP) superfamily protein YafD